MKISIVVPNYNYDSFISRTIESIVNQDFPDKEIIIVDDGSTDKSWEIITKYYQLYPDIIKIIQQPNQGQASAVNEGLKNVTGDIIGWINSDDTYCKNSLSQVMQLFSLYPSVDIVFGDINVIDINDTYMYKIRHYKFSYFLSVFLGFSNTVSSNAIFWKKNILKDSGHLNPTFKGGLDNDFFSRLTYKKNIKHINIPLANFRKQYITKAAIGNSNWDILVAKESNKVFYDSYYKLSISKYIPFKIGRHFKLIIVTIRRISKIITGRIIVTLFDKIKYERKYL